MKKSIIAAVAAGIMTIAGMAAVKTVSHKTSLFERNVEALASYEIPGEASGAMCSQTLSSGSYRMYNCDSCQGPIGYYSMDRVAFCQ